MPTNVFARVLASALLLLYVTTSVKAQVLELECRLIYEGISWRLRIDYAARRMSMALAVNGTVDARPEWTNVPATVTEDQVSAMVVSETRRFYKWTLNRRTRVLVLLGSEEAQTSTHPCERRGAPRD
jgi:hypothetical protein